jgi:cytochrome c biogenesis protein ResB
LTVEYEGRRFGVALRREQWVMPFTVALDEFTKEDHPRMMMPKSFSSDVVVIEPGSERKVKISMNEPLRQDGLVLYQASWGPSNARPGDRLFSTLAVVRNPADQYPLYSCIVIAIGLVMHFSIKLMKHIRHEAQRAA